MPMTEKDYDEIVAAARGRPPRKPDATSESASPLSVVGSGGVVGLRVERAENYAKLLDELAKAREDSERLLETGSDLDAALSKCTHLTGESETLDLERAKFAFRAAIESARKGGSAANSHITFPTGPV